jgi:hypothetical protein
MSGRTALAIGAGLLTGGIAYFAFAAIGLASLATVAAGIAFSTTAALIQGQGGFAGAGIPGAGAVAGVGTSNNSNVPKPEELQMATATEARPVPVTFGTVRLAGNHVRYDASTFRSEPIVEVFETIVPGQAIQEGGGGGGGKGGGGGGGAVTTTVGEDRVIRQERIIGYNYFLSWDYAICVGPVDRIVGIRVSPGEANALSGDPQKDGTADPNTIDFSVSGDNAVRTLRGPNGFGGSCRVYRGSTTQTRNAGDAYQEAYETHRGVCFAHFRDFKLGTTTAPATLLFEIDRFPKALDPEGDPIPDFPTRGSADTGHPAYRDANPAACLFELLTNRTWGAAVTHDLLDVESFARTARYFRDNNLGVSFTLSSQDLLSEAVNFLRDHVSSILVWNGQRLALRCLMDRSDAFTPMTVITRDQVSDVEFSRPTWPSTVNELRVEFVNRQNNHQREIVVVQDLGCIATVGRVQSRQIELLGFSNRDTAERQAKRLLLEGAYPQATLRFKSNRVHAGLDAGSFVQFRWPDWTDGQAITFWRVAEISDDQQDANGIMFTLLEDAYAQAYEGEPEPFVAPPLAFESGVTRQDSDLSLGDDHSILTAEDFGPVMMVEPPSVMTAGGFRALVAAQRRSGNVGYMAWAWKPDAGGAFRAMPNVAPWGILGTAFGAFPQTARIWRGAGLVVDLQWQPDGNTLLAATGSVVTTSDDFDALTVSPAALLVIGEEIIRVGNAVELFPGRWELTNLLRGEFGSEIASHPDGAPVAFIPALTSEHLLSLPSQGIEAGVAIDLQADQVLIGGQVVTDTTYEWTQTFTGSSRVPPAPTLLSIQDVTGDWTLTMRPRIYLGGTEALPSIEDDIRYLQATLTGYALEVQALDSLDAVLATTVLASYFDTAPAEMPAAIGITRWAWIPDNGTPGTAVLRIEATPGGTTAKLSIRAILAGQLSTALVAQP